MGGGTPVKDDTCVCDPFLIHPPLGQPHSVFGGLAFGNAVFFGDRTTGCGTYSCTTDFFSFFLRSSIGGVAYVTVFNSPATWAATFRLRGCTTDEYGIFNVHTNLGACRTHKGVGVGEGQTQIRLHKS